ncbi:hypothetical protein Daus18300_002686 [Diaporthe australafricana]|uniref:Uncharacterized protein n=1 Tax=Diaporthe australafricana TaxID=127596 RepID=A0ABR3XLL0_9PEZI
MHADPFHSWDPPSGWPEPEPDDYTILIVILSVSYVLGILWGAMVLRLTYPTVAPRDKPWVPALARGDACLTPVFFLLPALFWPLVFPALALGALGFILYSAAYGLWSLISPATATSCCGIPLPRRDGKAKAAAAAASSSSPDLEMGAVVACGEDGGGEAGGGEDGSDEVGGRCAGSGESERPPSYTSLPLDEDESGEADGLLAKGAQ